MLNYSFEKKNKKNTDSKNGISNEFVLKIKYKDQTKRLHVKEKLMINSKNHKFPSNYKSLLHFHATASANISII